MAVPIKKKFNRLLIDAMYNHGAGIIPTDSEDESVLQDDEGTFWKFSFEDINNCCLGWLEGTKVIPQMRSHVVWLDGSEDDYDDIQYIKHNLSAESLLAALAEECSELAQAALKLSRAITKENPTPRSVDDCWEDVYEEANDVTNCFCVLGLPFEENKDKLQRWVERIEHRDEDGFINR